MVYDFKDITISVFDIHTTIDPLRSQPQEYFRKEFSFFTNPVRYHEFSISGQSIKTDTFHFQPLSIRQQKTHFWMAYSNILHNGAKDPWKLQTPFVSHADKINLRLNMHEPDIKITTRPAIYLSSLGWSTNILIRLQGNIKNRQLIQIMGRLASKELDDTPFVIADKPKTLTETFKFFQNLLLSEVYIKPPHLGMKIPRHFIVSLNKYNGPRADYKKMENRDKDLMHSILYGKEFGALEEGEEQKKPSLLLTHISVPYNFALTDFDHGTLLFPQRDALSTKREGSVHCLATNVRDCIMMTYTLLYFYKLSKGFDINTLIGSLRENVRSTLQQLPEKYTNQVCRNLFLNHKFLRTLISEDIQGKIPIAPSDRTKVFISYSHKDSKWLKRLQTHLKPLEREMIIDRWDDTMLKPGSNWREEIKKALCSARVAVLLISADFLASDFIATDELPPMLLAAKNDGATILPVIVSPSQFEQIESLSQFQTLRENSPSRPLNGMRTIDRESVFVKLAQEIKRVFNEGN